MSGQGKSQGRRHKSLRCAMGAGRGGQQATWSAKAGERGGREAERQERQKAIAGQGYGLCGGGLVRSHYDI